MKITTVLLHYWKERTKNISRIIDDLNSGSRKPDKIIVFNNNKDINYPSRSGISVINSDTNYGCRVRACVALFEHSDFYYFIDDDTTVREDTLKNFAENADKNFCLGYRGIKIDTNHPTYQEGLNIWGNAMKKPQRVDMLAGNGTFFVPYSILLKFFDTEKKLLKRGWKYGNNSLEDLMITANHSFVLPAGSNEFIINLNEGGVGLCNRKEHWGIRNDVARRLYEKIY